MKQVKDKYCLLYTSSAAGALHAETANGGMLRAACYERGCTLTAKADAGYRFAGWYADEGDVYKRQ